MNRPQLIFLPIIALGLLILAVFSLQPTCVDPSGCSWYKPGASVFIGLNRISNGTDRISSLQVLQAANLALETLQPVNGHPLKILAVDTNCLPGDPDSSASELAGNKNIIAVLGPVCQQNQAAFEQAILFSGKASLAPTPILDLPLFARQAIHLYKKAGLGSHSYVLRQAGDSNEFVTLFCQALSQLTGQCTIPDEDNPDPVVIPDTILVVSLKEVVTDLPLIPDNLVGLPVVIISLSRPYLPDILSNYYWIGPNIWNKLGPYLNLPENKDNLPPSIAGMASFEAVNLIIAAIQKTKQPLWDGSWIIPHQAFSKQIDLESQESFFFSNTCCLNSSTNKLFSLTVFQVARLEYNNLYP